MNRYSAERKQSVIKKMMPPMNIPVSQLTEETGISDVTLYHWRKQARARGLVVPGDGFVDFICPHLRENTLISID